MCAHVLPERMSVHHVHAWCPYRQERTSLGLTRAAERQVRAVMWVLGNEPRSSATVLNLGVISLGPSIFLTLSGHWGTIISQYRLCPYLHEDAILQWLRNLPMFSCSLRTQISMILFHLSNFSKQFWVEERNK